MENPRPDKVAVVDEVRERLDSTSAALLTEYRGLDVAAISDLRRALRQVGGEYELAFEISGESFLTPPGALSDLVCDAVESIVGRRPALSTTGGTSDARFIRDYSPVIEFGLVGQTMHKVDERVSLDDIRSLTAIYHSMLERYFDRR